MKTCGVILAGGKSSRMGTNKALLLIKDKPVIQWIYESLQPVVDKVIVIANDEENYSFLEIPIFPDRFLNKGPLAGIDSAFHNSNCEKIIVTACDTPFVHTEVFEFLLKLDESADITVPIYEGNMHPLSAVYKKNVHPIIYQKLINDDLKVREVFDEVKTIFHNRFLNIDDDILKEHFFNMNYPNEYEFAKSIK